MPSRKVTDWIDGFLELTTNTEASLEYRKWTAISVLASALRRKCFLDWGSVGKFYPNMYIVLVGPSGARKTTAMRLGEYFLDQVGIAKSSEAITREALIQELEGALSIDGEDQYQHSSLTVFAEELTVFLGYRNDELMSNLCAWFDCKDVWTYKTKGSGTNDVIGVWVNILGATTPRLIRSNLPLDAIGGGLASRIIFVYSHRKAKTIAFPFETPAQVALRQKLLDDYHIINGLKGGFKFTESFRDEWIDWYARQETEDPFMFSALFDGYSSRRPGHLLKLCMILSASRDNRLIIDSEVFNRAKEYLTEVEADMPLTFQGLGSSKNSDLQFQMMQAIERKRTITKAELIRLFGTELDSMDHFDQVISILIAKGFCKKVVIGKEKKKVGYIYTLDEVLGNLNGQPSEEKTESEKD